MKEKLRKGSLVHVPQSVMLVDCDDPEDAPQLTIPLRVHETEEPTIGVVTGFNNDERYVKIFCNGDWWAVDPGSVYEL
jgi:hypothetical protein